MPIEKIPLGRLRAAGVAMAAVALVVFAWSLRDRPYLCALAWSALLLASFTGWGSLVALWVAPRRSVDWGLRAGWGMAFFVVCGGYLCLLHVATRPVLIAQVAIGVASLFVVGVSRGRRWTAARLRRRLLVAAGHPGLCVLIGVGYAISVFVALAYLGNHYFQPSDDPPLYFTLTEKLVQSGSLLEPYAARRASTFGGQVYLDASFASVASLYYIHVVDAGLSLVVVVALLVGHVGQRGPRAARLLPLGLALLLVFTLGNVRVNTASLVSGAAAILTLYRTLRLPGDSPGGRRWPLPPRRTIAVAALATTCLLLRTTNAGAVLPFVGLVVLSDFAVDRPRGKGWGPWKELARVVGQLIATALLVLLPWAILMRRSCGTFFYPFGHSNITPGWTFLATGGGWDRTAGELVEHLFHDEPIALFFPFAVAGLATLRGPGRNDLAALTIGSLLAMVVLSREAAAFGPINTARYYFGYVVATSLVVAASAGGAGAPAAIVGAALAMHLTVHREETHTLLTDFVKMAVAAGREPLPAQRAYDALDADYRDVQSHVPAGKTIAAAVFEGFRFDFERNPVFSLDVLGGMGPKPGWPAQKGARALGDYLRTNGVDYLVWVDFNLPSEFYNRAHWQTHLSKTGHYLQGEAVFQLDAEDAIEKLTSLSHVVYQAHGMTVVDLRAP